MTHRRAAFRGRPTVRHEATTEAPDWPGHIEETNDMMLITKEIDAKLRENHKAARETDAGSECFPPLKLFNPCGAATWLITERDPENPDLLFGLCDLGMQSPEIGYVSLAEITAVRLPFGLGIERDQHFKPTKTLGEYAAAARDAGRIAA